MRIRPITSEVVRVKSREVTHLVGSLKVPSEFEEYILKAYILI